MRSLSTRAALLAFSALLSAGSLVAQDVYTGAADATWSNNGNWLDNSEPTLTDAVQFPSLVPVSGSAITLSAGELAASLAFLNSYQLTGGDLTLAAASSISVDPTFTASIGSILAGAGTSLAKTGNGTLVLSGANTFTGAFNIAAGVVNVQNNLALGTTAGGTAITSGAALELQGGVTITGEALALNGTGVGGGGALRNVSGTNAFTGTITLGSASSIMSDAGTLSVGIVALGTNALTIGGAGDISVTASNTGSGTMTKVGDGTLTFTADPNSTGQLTINGGMVVLNHTGTTDFSMVINSGATLRTITASLGDTTGDVTVNAGGTFDVRSGSDTMGGLTGAVGGIVTRGVTGAATLTVNNGNETTAFAGVIENGGAGGTLAITKAGSGTLTLTGSNTYTGTTAVNAGTLVISGATGSIASTTVNIGDNNGGGEAMVWGAVGDVVAGPLNRIVDTANVTLNGSATGGLTMNGPASGSGGNEELIGTLTASAGRNSLTLVAGTGNSTQLTATTFTRSNAGVLLVRGADLGGTAVGSTRLVLGNGATHLTGSGGADGTTSKSIIRYMIGDTDATGAGSGFLTYDTANGVRLLTAAEYESSIAGLDQALRNVSVGSTGETVSTDVRVNSLRVTDGGTVSINAGTYVRVHSGAVLLVGNGTTGGAISGAGFLDFGTTEGIITLAQNTSAVTANVNAALAGTAGITVSRSSNVPTSIINIGGTNTAIGTFTVNQGIVALTDAGALNSKYPMTVILRAASTLQLNGNNVTIRDLQGTSGTGIFTNGAATAATLTTYLTTNRTLQTVLQNGSTGALNLVVSSDVGENNVLTLDADASATGTVEVRQGTLTLTGANGTLNDFTAYAINGGTMRLSNSTAHANRLRDASGITFNAGTFDFDNPGGASYSETVGVVTLQSGANNIIVDKSGTGTSTLTLSGLIRGTGATLNLSSQSAGTPVFDLGASTQSRLVINGSGPNDDGIIGGWMTMDSLTAGGREFVKYVSTGVVSATALTDSDYTFGLASGSNPTANHKLGLTPLALTSNTEINSLNVQQVLTPGLTTVIDLGGFTLRVESGGIIVSSASNASFNNGVLTAGNGNDVGGELFFHVTTPAANPVDVNAVISNNGTGVVNLVKTGTGILDLSGVTNTYTGKTFINGGTLRINSDANLGAAPGSSALDALVIGGGSTLDVTASMTLNANRSITVGPGSNVISISSGTSGNGRVLTFNGTIHGTAGEGSLHFKSNLVATTGVDSGEINATLSVLNLTGSFREDAGTVTVTGITNVIGRSLQVGMDGIASLIYNRAGGNLTVGKGINDTLEIGVNTSDVTSTDGTLNVSALDNFTVNVDIVRMGRASSGQTGKGTLLLATNNDIVAGTSFTMGETANSGNSAVTSSLVFGSGTNNLTTRTFTVGGNKSVATATVQSGGVVNLLGFAENTLDMFVANYGNTGTTGTTSTFNMTGGTLNASLNNLVIGQKTGGAAGSVSGVFTVTGTGNAITANNVTLSNMNGGVSASGTNTGTLNFGGGTFIVYNDVAMATFVNTTAAAGVNGVTSTGNLNITGGVFTIAGNITRTVDVGSEARANSYINVNGGTLDMQNQAAGDTTKGNINVSQLAFRSGSMVDVEKVTLAATSSTLGAVPGAVAGDALILGSNLTASFDVELTGASGGNIHFISTGSGFTTLDGDVDLGTVSRNIIVDDVALQSNELVVDGAISGSGSVTKQGTGGLALRGTNTYTGTTTVSAGALEVGAGGLGLNVGYGTTGTGATTVASGAILGGTGTIMGSTATHVINGTLAPGDFLISETSTILGNLSIEGNLVFGSSAVIELNIGAPTSPGSTYDRITGLTVGATLHLDGRINTANTLNDGFFTFPYTPSVGDSWSLIDWATALDLTNFNIGTNMRTGADSAGDEGDLDLPDISALGYFWDVSNFANDGTISIAAIPEPSRMLLLLAGTLSLTLRRRRKAVA